MDWSNCVVSLCKHVQFHQIDGKKFGLLKNSKHVQGTPLYTYLLSIIHQSMEIKGISTFPLVLALFNETLKPLNIPQLNPYIHTNFDSLLQYLNEHLHRDFSPPAIGNAPSIPFFQIHKTSYSKKNHYFCPTCSCSFCERNKKHNSGTVGYTVLNVTAQNVLPKNAIFKKSVLAETNSRNTELIN
ncbi:hypothetical protein NCAS_0I02640 [Naumovozyma castellii]|uniref:Uncharacterized protein n=1 Tax=Naumovozyma castellii TaxID=27288 RepID=G0VK98_NAUCA|nr:hypothetical protein NCAS_0I02640 [Naumovozyma castellii CBS 4309]CCC71932.1 hypothetical protein NCAS_0I02640 [Naumovozyma castellii CBS 4309]